MIARHLLMFRLARRSISRRLLQSVLFVVGVALGVAVGVAIDLANNSAKNAFNLSAESIAGRTTHQIVAGSGGLPTELYEQVRIDLGLRLSAPIVEAYVRSPDLDEQPLHLLGVDTFAEAPFRDYLTTATIESENRESFDALNLFLTTPGTALLSQSMAERHGLLAGDTLTLRINAQPVTVRIAGLLHPGDALSAQAISTLLLTDIATAQELLGQPGTLTRIDLILPENYDTGAIQAILPLGAQLTMPNASNSVLNQMTAAFELNLRALSLLALVVGVFLIYNTVTFSVVQRRQTIGVMRSLGATRRQIFTLILGEALLLGFLGTILGLALGMIMGRAVVGSIAQTISDLYFSVTVERVTVSPATLLTGVSVGLLASLTAALVPSYEATRTPPVGTMRRSDVESRTRQFTPFMTTGAFLLTLSGIVVLNLPTQSIIAGFIALFMIVVGCALLTPLGLIVAMRLLLPVASRLLGVIGHMAPRNVIRTQSRTAVAVAALTVAVSVIVGVGVMIGSFRRTVTDWLDTTLGADIFISPVTVTATTNRADLSPDLVDRIGAVEGVAEVTTVRDVSVIAPDYPSQPPVKLTVPSHDISHGRRQFVWTTAPGGNYWDALVAGDLLVSEPFAFRRGITPDQNTLTLLTDRGPEAFTIRGVFYDYTTDQGTVMMQEGIYRRYFNDPFISALGLILAPGADQQAIIDTLRADTLAGLDLNIRSNRSLRESALEVFERTFSITVALQLLAMLVAFIGVLSALMALQLEQARQYAVMRANGMTPHQMRQLVLTETGLMGMTAGLLAIPIGLVLAIVLIEVINVRSFGWSMQLAFTPGEFVGAFLVAVLAALAAGIYPAWRLSRQPVSEGLRTE